MSAENTTRVYHAPFNVELAIMLKYEMMPWLPGIYGTLKRPHKGPTAQEVATAVGCSYCQMNTAIRTFRYGGFDALADYNWNGRHKPKRKHLPEDLCRFAVRPSTLRDQVGLGYAERCIVLKDKFGCEVTPFLLKQVYKQYRVRYGTIVARLGGPNLPGQEVQRKRIT